MKRYTFRLQSVMASRVTIEELRRADMLAAKAAYEASVHRVAELMTSMADEADAARAGGVVSSHSLTGRAEQFTRHRVAIESAKSERDVLDAQMVEAYDLWAAAKRDLRMLERLDEQHRETWISEVEKADQDETDEVAMSRAGVLA